MKKNNKNMLGTIEVSSTEASKNKFELFLDIKCNLFRSGLELRCKLHDLKNLILEIYDKIDKSLKKIRFKNAQISCDLEPEEKTEIFIDESNLTAQFKCKIQIKNLDKISKEEIKILLERCFEDYTVLIPLKKSSILEISKLYQDKYSNYF
jgi:hypothetical protein